MRFILKFEPRSAKDVVQVGSCDSALTVAS